MPAANRGEVWQVDLGLAAKVRPALILSVSYRDNERVLHAVVPHTTAPRGTRFEVTFQVPGLEAGAFDLQGLRSVPASVLMRKRATLTVEQMRQIEAVAKEWLGLK